MGTPRPGMRISGNADVRECGAWECGCLGACGAWGMRVSGNAEPGNAEPGNADVLECGVRGLPAGPIGPAGTVPPDRAAQNGAAYWRHGAAAWNGAANRRHGSGGGRQSRRPIGRRQEAGGGGRVWGTSQGRWGRPGVTLGRPGVGTLGRPGVLPSCGTAGAARPVWCRLLAARFMAARCCRADAGWLVWCLQLEARFGPARFGDAVPGTVRGPGEGACQKTVCWPGWLGRASGGVIGGGLWGARRRVRGTGPGSGRTGPGERRRGAGDCLAGAGEAVDAGAGVSGGGLWKTGPGGAAPGCGVWGLEERGLGGEQWPEQVWLWVFKDSQYGISVSVVSIDSQYREASAETWYPSTDAGKLKRDKATRKQGMQGVGAAKRGAGEMLRESRLRS